LFVSAEAAGPDGLRKCRSEKGVLSALAPPKDVEHLQVEGYGNVNIFTYNELRLSTKNFRPDQILGEGGFGVVYKGVIDENVRAGFPSRQVAVKELNPEGFQGDKEWLVSLISFYLLLNLTIVIYILQELMLSPTLTCF
jgi:serine/threonine protein kinase